MVTIIKKYTGGAYPFLEFACLSTDTKPVDLVPDNSICHEIDTGKKYYFANKAWHEAPSRGGGSGGGGLPADFPAEGIANADKFLGFDANGDYAALDAPSGAEKFVVTLTKENDTWTADKSLADIYAAYDDGKIVEALYPDSDINFALPLSVVVSAEGIIYAMFTGVKSSGDDHTIVTVIGSHQESDGWDVKTQVVVKTGVPSYSSSNNDQVLGVSSGNLAWVDPELIVTLNISDNAMVGDKTYGDVLEASLAGRSIKMIFDGEIGGVATQSIVNPVSVYASSGSVMVLYFTAGASGVQEIHGAATDDVTISLGS